MNFSKIIASFFGIGLIGRGAGSIAAAVFCALMYLCEMFQLHTDLRLLAFSIVIFFLGVAVSKETEKVWGEDSNKIVIDEVLGMAVTMLFMPMTWQALLAGFVLFRFFDIAKPLYIRRLEKFGNGWGVMLDDLAAGVYANVMMWLLVAFIPIFG